MPSTITFDTVTAILPNPTTGVRIDGNFVFQVTPKLFSSDPGVSETYAYPDIAEMMTSGLFKQHTSNANLTGGYGIVRAQNTKATGTSGGSADLGTADYPNDWGISANFGAKLPCAVAYCNAIGGILTEAQAVEQAIEMQPVYILLNPSANFAYLSKANALLEHTLPYKTLVINV